MCALPSTSKRDHIQPIFMFDHIDGGQLPCELHVANLQVWPYCAYFPVQILVTNQGAKQYGRKACSAKDTAMKRSYSLDWREHL